MVDGLSLFVKRINKFLLSDPRVDLRREADVNEQVAALDARAKHRAQVNDAEALSHGPQHDRVVRHLLLKVLVDHDHTQHARHWFSCDAVQLLTRMKVVADTATIANAASAAITTVDAAVDVSVTAVAAGRISERTYDLPRLARHRRECGAHAVKATNGCIVELRGEIVGLQVQRAELRARRPAGQRVVVVALGAHAARVDAHDAESRAPLLLVHPFALHVEAPAGRRLVLMGPVHLGLNLSQGRVLKIKVFPAHRAQPAVLPALYASRGGCNAAGTV
eukprot:1849680-Pleurochrysis_carterae.AAC.3